MNPKNKRIAIVYDWVDKWGGVERVLQSLKEMFPEADFYTSYCDLDAAPWAKEFHFQTSFLQKMPNFIKKNRVLSVLLYPYAFESFNFNDYDVVISVTSSFAKGIVTRPQTLHICYLLTPTRFLWVYPQTYAKKGVFNLIFEHFLSSVRTWDFIAAQRPDAYISLSEAVRARSLKSYKRSCEVAYPPFSTHYWQTIQSNVKEEVLDKKIVNIIKQLGKFYLVVSRLEPYKKVELAIEACNKMNVPLIIVGSGSQKAHLESLATEFTVFLSHISDVELSYLYSHAEALIMPQEEDFGYVSLEAQYNGCPVIAYNRGGATETVIQDITGIFFSEQSSDAIMEALARFHSVSYNVKSQLRKTVHQHIRKFSEEQFKNTFKKYLS
jgi:glycosyltransferase involved in cell wall biosynthesis